MQDLIWEIAAVQSKIICGAQPTFCALQIIHKRKVGENFDINYEYDNESGCKIIRIRFRSNKNELKRHI